LNDSVCYFSLHNKFWGTLVISEAWVDHDLASEINRINFYLLFSLDPNPYITLSKAPNWFNAHGYVLRDNWTGQMLEVYVTWLMGDHKIIILY